jgi:uncharacterized membrane protein HdeD (DUF308 family)
MNSRSDTNQAGSGVEFMSIERFAPKWWAVALRAVAAILFGLIALFVPGATILSLVLLFAAYMLVSGAFAIVDAIVSARRHERWGLTLLTGILDIAAGLIAALWPSITVLAFIALFAAWSLLSGILMLAGAISRKGRPGRWWLALNGVVSVVFGVLLVIAPLVGAVVLTWWLGAFVFAFGVLLLIFAFRLRAATSY